MTQPKTLLQMAGADTTPNALSESALVLIDCQMEYVTGAVPLGSVEDALAEAGRIGEAQATVEKAKQIEPTLSISDQRDRFSGMNETVVNSLLDSLRKAGFPE